MKNADMILVELCMGSACFALGNNRIVDVLQNFVKIHALSDRIQIKGAFCEGLCKKGPIVKINGTLYYNQSAEMLVTLLQQMIGNN